MIKYYTTGQFAKLCHTTKETLFHYDEVGVLKPAKIDHNGYRKYIYTQYLDYDLIRVLQRSNMSLKEIKEFIDEKSNERYIEVLKAKKEELELEKKQIENQQYRIDQAILMSEYGMDKVHMVPFVEECKEEYLLVIKLPDHKISKQEMILLVSEHFHYCDEHHLVEELPLGTIINKENIINNSFKENYYYVKLNKPVVDNRYLLKKKGTYVSILHEGYYDTIDISLNKLIHYIYDHDYEIIGDCFEYEINNYLNVNSKQRYLILISILVRKMI